MPTITTNISAENFINLTQLSFSVSIDYNLWAITDATVHPSLFFDTILDYLVGGYILTFIWNDSTELGISIPNGESLVDITLDFIGPGEDCGTTTFMNINNVNVSYGPGFQSIPYRVLNGALEACFTLGPVEPITITCINPPTINITPGDSIILDYTVKNFYRIKELDFTIYFDAAQWNFSEMTYINPAIVNLSVVNNFNVAQLSNGLIGVSWVHPFGDTTLPTDAAIFSMALKSKSTSNCGQPSYTGLNSALIPARALEAASNTEVVVQNTGVSLEVCTIPVPPNTNSTPLDLYFQVLNPEWTGQNYDPGVGGTTFSVNVCCENFYNIKYFQFTLQYRRGLGFGPGQLLGHTIVPQSLPGSLTEGSWNISYEQADVPFTWDNGSTGITLPDGDVLFRIDFLTGPINCNLISFVDITGNAVPLLARKGTTDTQVNIYPGQRVILSICDQ
jgi:hypothetical protein